MRKKQFSRLDKLCLKSIATNVVHHAKNFNEADLGSEIHTLYKTFQFLYPGAILKELECIYQSNKQQSSLFIERSRAGIGEDVTLTKPIDPFTELTAFLFQGRMPTEALSVWQSLKLLFDENTNEARVQIPVDSSGYQDVAEMYLSALSFCKLEVARGAEPPHQLFHRFYCHVCFHELSVPQGLESIGT